LVSFKSTLIDVLIHFCSVVLFKSQFFQLFVLYNAQNKKSNTVHYNDVRQ